MPSLQARLIEVGRTWSRGIANSIASAYSILFLFSLLSSGMAPGE
ncbi:hypothetical protein RchiOBHm_Chr3g0495441 [Rosa chinensis]|uniref:Uncharacterized protein n=1 Tax=Rosa chinensis TaxID=74649 RepID=A0A2P6RH84_ROSCH|nr:hypothetical protein RchiOBHm_Chr3g0495441 [Rosa chinensis]